MSTVTVASGGALLLDERRAGTRGPHIRDPTRSRLWSLVTLILRTLEALCTHRGFSNALHCRLNRHTNGSGVLLRSNLAKFGLILVHARLGFRQLQTQLDEPAKVVVVLALQRLELDLPREGMREAMREAMREVMREVMTEVMREVMRESSGRPSRGHQEAIQRGEI